MISRFLFTGVFLLLLGNEACAQNWRLVRENDTLVYEKTDNNRFYTVWIDSTNIVGVDTVFFINRIMPGAFIGQGQVSCDTLAEFIEGYYQYDRPQFIGGSFKVSGSKWKINYPTGSMLLFPEQAVGYSWIYDTANLLSMSVTSIDTMYLPGFEILDSVKIIDYGNGKLYVSKRHGLIARVDSVFPELSYNLIGVQNLDLGETIPMGMDFFDFEVGDAFFYYDYFASSESYASRSELREVVSKTIAGDTIIYKFRLNGGNTFVTKKYWPEKYPFLNAFPNTIALCGNDLLNLSGFYSSDSTAWYYALNYVSRDSTGRVYRFTEEDYLNNGWLTGAEGYCVYDTGLVIQKFGFPGPSVVFKEGLGAVAELLSSLITKGMVLKGYTQNNDTTGSFIFSVNELENNLQIKFFPNPAWDVLTIELAQLNGVITLNLLDLQGRLLMKKQFENRIEINTSSLKSGIYIAIIKNRKGNVIHREKIVLH